MLLGFRFCFFPVMLLWVWFGVEIALTDLEDCDRTEGHGVWYTGILDQRGLLSSEHIVHLSCF